MKEIVQLLLVSPDDMLEASAVEMIKKWSPEPTSLETLDKSIYYALGSGIAIMGLQELYRQACKAEGKTHEDNVSHAHWRNEE